MKIALDGSAAGKYRGDCECGFSWSGDVSNSELLQANPTMAIAETVVHMRMVHSEQALNLYFTERFERWLFKIWQVASATGELHESTITR